VNAGAWVGHAFAGHGFAGFVGTTDHVEAHVLRAFARGRIAYLTYGALDSAAGIFHARTAHAVFITRTSHGRAAPLAHSVATYFAFGAHDARARVYLAQEGIHVAKLAFFAPEAATVVFDAATRRIA
jgi:hypothetical protein